MNNAALTPPMEVAGWDPKLPFDLVVAYEDLETRNRALHLYDHLAQQLLDDYDFQCSWWKFDHLSNSTLGQQAADAAIEANMVILSLRVREELPRAHQQWLEDWTSRRHFRKAALVAILAGSNSSEREAGHLLAYLQNAARLARMDFFNHTFELPQPPREMPVAQLAAQAPVATPFLQGLLQHRSPVPRWGINE